MAISLYDLSVVNYLQTLGAVSHFLDRGMAHFEENNVDSTAFCDTRLYPDMLPFRFQILSVTHHSLGAIEGVKKGVFTPPGLLPTGGYPELQKLVADTRESLQKLTPDEVNDLEGKDVVFKIGERQMPFVAEGFLMSFSMPNFFFHSTTAYDILRSNGVPLGKRDFMGQMRMKV
jgi:hypothetical protein